MRNRPRFARQGPQPADPGLVLGAPTEVAVPVCRSAYLQIFGIAGLEFVCVFGHDAFERMFYFPVLTRLHFKARRRRRLSPLASAGSVPGSVEIRMA